ncbi:hypothetical protein [Curtobacterium sp. RIT-PI-V]|jgi:hypothetical protein|uniref:hypothetical protein n=1 Tax=Curtobacterium sp. RIT-PI-V TaxID=3035296 RepID=UPI0021DA0332|nr:hypothetical protein [Curtobacterium sp. RIT-PI-V]
MAVLHAAAFWCAALIFLARTPYVLRNPRGRAAWGATGVGALGLLTLGSVVPQTVLDGALGGTNLINLVQNVCATAAFWLMLRASTSDLPKRPGLASPLALLVVVVAFAVPFFAVRDRGGTDFHFIVREIHQPAMWLYGSVYMVGVGVIAAATLRYGVLRNPVALVVFRVGLSLVVIASIDELLSLTADHFGWFPAPLRDGLRLGFDPPFYLGIVLIVVAMASLTFRRWWRDVTCRRHHRLLRRIVRRHELRAVERDGDVQARTYDLVIAIRDAEVQGRTLDDAELAQVRSAELTLTRSLGG